MPDQMPASSAQVSGLRLTRFSRGLVMGHSPSTSKAWRLRYQARKRRTLGVVPPRKCSAKVAATGAPCPQWAVPGVTVCDAHGARAPQVRAVAAREMALAEVIAASPRRSPAEVMADTGHRTDVAARYIWDRLVQEGEPIPVELLAEHRASQALAFQVAKVNREAGIDLATVEENALTQMRFVMQVAGAALGLDLAEPQVREAITAAVDVLSKVPTDEWGKQVQAKVHEVRWEAMSRQMGADSVKRSKIIQKLREAARKIACEVCDTPHHSQGRGGCRSCREAPPRPGGAAEADRLAVAATAGGVAGSGDVVGGAVVEEEGEDRGPVRAVAEVRRAVAPARCSTCNEPGHGAMDCPLTAMGLGGGQLWRT